LSDAAQSTNEDRRRALRESTRHSFPTGDIDQMLREIEQGRSEGPS